MSLLSSSRAHCCKALVLVVGYVLLVVALSWPLPRHLTTHLLGDPGGDTGVYVWNLWVFRHELVDHGRLPLSTEHLFGYTGGADFSLHNYTPIAGAVGTLLIPSLGVVGTFNLLMLAFLSLSGLATYLLGRRVGLSTVAAWIAGALFISAPVMTARETAHFSLVTAAPLPLFLWALLRALNDRRRRSAALVGVVVAAAVYADAYYGAYCVIMGTFVLAWRFLRLGWRETPAPSTVLRNGCGTVAVMAASVIALYLVTGPTDATVGSLKVGLTTLYTPMLILVCAVAARAWLTWYPRVVLHDPAGDLRVLFRRGALSVAVSSVVLAPELAGLAVRSAQGRLPDVVTPWRNSPRGVDLLGYLVPNPNHAWLGSWTHGWLLPGASDAFPEFVASFSLIAVASLCVVALKYGLPRMWVAFTALFVLLSLGPFIHIGGMNTFVVGPWAFLRYLPPISLARSPARFAIVAALGLSILCAFAVDRWLARPRRGAWVAALVGLLVSAEVIPAPRVLYSATVPDVYQQAVLGGEGTGRLLELPTGIRDGTSSIGDFRASSQYFQTAHERPLIGGYVSRISNWRKRENREAPILAGLHALSEGSGPLPPDLLARARASREMFLARSCVGRVVLDKARASLELRAFAVEALGLVSVYEDKFHELLVPTSAPVCDGSRP